MPTLEQWVQEYGIPEALPYLQSLIHFESTDNPAAVNDSIVKETGRREYSVGLFQMNMLGGLGSGHSEADLKNPDYNTKAALEYIAPRWKAARAQGATPTQAAWASIGNDWGAAPAAIAAVDSGWTPPARGSGGSAAPASPGGAFNPTPTGSYGIAALQRLEAQMQELEKEIAGLPNTEEGRKRVPFLNQQLDSLYARYFQGITSISRESPQDLAVLQQNFEFKRQDQEDKRRQAALTNARNYLSDQLALDNISVADALNQLDRFEKGMEAAGKAAEFETNFAEKAAKEAPLPGQKFHAGLGPGGPMAQIAAMYGRGFTPMPLETMNISPEALREKYMTGLGLEGGLPQIPERPVRAPVNPSSFFSAPGSGRMPGGGLTPSPEEAKAAAVAKAHAAEGTQALASLEAWIARAGQAAQAQGAPAAPTDPLLASQSEQTDASGNPIWPYALGAAGVGAAAAAAYALRRRGSGSEVVDPITGDILSLPPSRENFVNGAPGPLYRPIPMDPNSSLTPRLPEGNNPIYPSVPDEIPAGVTHPFGGIPEPQVQTPFTRLPLTPELPQLLERNPIPLPETIHVPPVPESWREMLARLARGAGRAWR